ncbi:hypothetical protein RRG08_054715 [Elysia crispata]|uniref:Uncharacterized protein n=1 Tax=Elysia crispata TaxID=231223 RepID=A0AAE1B353_9GAST|nr:hypothetical protein RRG08_054715 [Elysia crispata]
MVLYKSLVIFQHTFCIVFIGVRSRSIRPREGQMMLCAVAANGVPLTCSISDVANDLCISSTRPSSRDRTATSS